jgi:hypothetical protein
MMGEARGWDFAIWLRDIMNFESTREQEGIKVYFLQGANWRSAACWSLGRFAKTSSVVHGRLANVGNISWRLAVDLGTTLPAIFIDDLFPEKLHKTNYCSYSLVYLNHASKYHCSHLLCGRCDCHRNGQSITTRLPRP